MAEFDRLAPLVAKTGGASECQAFEFLRRHVAAQAETNGQH
jgi:hypothetical protein